MKVAEFIEREAGRLIFGLVSLIVGVVVSAVACALKFEQLATFGMTFAAAASGWIGAVMAPSVKYIRKEDPNGTA